MNKQAMVSLEEAYAQSETAFKQYKEKVKEIMDKTNSILEKHHVKAEYIPESLLVYAIFINEDAI